MLDFNKQTYDQLLRLAINRNIVSNCREYPSLVYGGRLYPAEEMQEHLRIKFAQETFKCGLYVHFPFCISRCYFCKYYSEVKRSDTQLDNFLLMFEREVKSYNIDFKVRNLKNLFIGGGTPTILNEARSERLLKIIHRYFSFDKGAQKTIEGSPESLTLGKLKIYNELGINRISIGLQSSNDQVLKGIGRKHTVKDIFKAFSFTRKSGIRYVGTEIIWGLPKESLATYLKTYNDLLKLSPDFIEGYVLTTGGRVRIGRSQPLNTTLDKAIDLAKEKLLSNGYLLAFEGNFLGFVKKGIPIPQAVNQNTDSLYRHQAFVLGLGPGSSTHFPDRKYMIVSDYNKYCKELSQGFSPAMKIIDVSDDDYQRHYIISQIGFFRRLYKKEYRNMFHKEFSQDYPIELSLLKNEKIITETPEQYIWSLSDHELGHEAFYAHILKYWYSPKYIRWIISNYLSKEGANSD